MAAPVRLRSERVLALPVIVLGAVVLRLISGVGFANYDTLYALAWGGQLARGQTPAYGVAIAPTPHPLIELLGLILYPLGPARGRGRRRWRWGSWRCRRAAGSSTGSARVWFGRAAGALGGAAVPDARAGPLLRGARLCGHPLPAAGAERAARRVPPPAGRRAGPDPARARRACCARRPGSSRACI